LVDHLRYSHPELFAEAIPRTTRNDFYPTEASHTDYEKVSQATFEALKNEGKFLFVQEIEEGVSSVDPE